MKKEITQKINRCKALQGKTIDDLCNTEEFRANMSAYLEAQKQDREAIQSSYAAMRKLGGAKGYKLPAHVIDRVKDLSVPMFIAEFVAVIHGASKRTSAERQYIRQLGMQAFNKTVAEFVVAEFPELADELLPKAIQN